MASSMRETLDTASRRRALRFAPVGMQAQEFLVGLVPYVVLVALIAWLAILEPASFSVNQLNVIANESMVLILIAIGQTIVLLTGGIDLSVGGVLSVVSAVAATRMTTGRDVILVALLLLVLGWIPGLINGLLITYARLQPFIVTLAMWFIWAGVAFYILPSAGGTIDSSLAFLSTGSVAGVPNPIWLLIASILGGIWLLRTRLGLEIKSIGSDREAAFHSGIRVRRAVIAAYMLSSFCTVLAGIVLSAQSMSGDPTVGNSYILPSVAAAVVGGTSLTGGWGTTTGSIAGALVLSYVASVTFALGLPAQWSLIFEGLLLILSVSIRFVVHLLFHGRKEA